jgi:2,4-dienoyl-CoA reductase-like NADH-dependent reductase (Old Yellow Enzyme family)
LNPKLFTPIELGGVSLPNRIVVSPMCQYSAQEGRMTDWHLMHLGQYACSGAGMMMVEATGVTPEGRITHGCTGLYDDATEKAMARALGVYSGITKHPIGIQLAHAGRKASTHPPFAGGKPLGAGEDPWQTLAPSPIPFGPGWHVPHELSALELKDLTEKFVSATNRANRLGFDAV